MGARTAWLDNPTLTLRLWPGRRSPLRVVLGKNIALPPSSPLLTDGLPTELVTASVPEASLLSPNVHYSVLDFSQPVVPQLLASLYREGVTSLLVEGGAATLQSFIDAGLWNEAHVETAPFDLDDGVRAPRLVSAVLSGVTEYGSRRVEHYVRSENLS